MHIERHIVTMLASKLSDNLFKDAIKELKEMSPQEMLSGEDSCLKNVWEEICVQVQDERSGFWDVYEETIDGLLAIKIEALDSNERLALWLTTDTGRDYIDDHHGDEKNTLDIPVDTYEIIVMLKDNLLSAAADYESSSISRFLWGQDDDIDDGEEEVGGEDGCLANGR